MNITELKRTSHYVTNKHLRTVWLRAFRMWQHRPHEVAPLSDAFHECSSCKTSFQGNYCPRCGQSAAIARFSFKRSLLLFLDVWGVGNRSMFRSIRDLLFRPGYMIRDYLSGMQSAYFPPLKMFFLLTALSFVVEHGFTLGLNEKSETYDEPTTEQVEEVSEDATERHLKVNGKEVESPMFYAGVKFAKTMDMFREKNPAIFALLSLIVFSLPLYFFLRKSPTIPDLRFSEFIIALVYTANCYSIFSIVGNLFNSTILGIIAVLMVFVALKQFSGFSKHRLLGYITLTVIISIIVLATLLALGLFILYKTSNIPA